MSDLEHPVDALVDHVKRFTAADVDAIIAATERFSGERNHALLTARQLAHKRVESWAEYLTEAENVATKRFYAVHGSSGDTLKRAVFWAAVQGAVLATMVRPWISLTDYYRLVKPVSKLVPWLADASGVGTDAPPEPEARPVEDDDPEGENDSSEENQMAIATQPTTPSKPKSNGKQAAQKRLAAAAKPTVAPAPAQTSTAPANGNGDHAQTEFFGKGKKEGVRVKPTRGGFSICIIGENHRVITGHFPSADIARKAAEKNGLTVKKMPGQRASAESEEKPEPGIERAAVAVAEKKPSFTPVPKPTAKAKAKK